MSTPGSTSDGGKRRSDVLDAIYEAVEESPQSGSGTSTHLFRAKALEQVDIPKQIDNLLPVTTPKIWIAIVGVAVALLAGGIYAAATPVIASVEAVGRAVAPSGVTAVEVTSDLVLVSTPLAENSSVAAGDVVATGLDNSGASVDLVAPVDGSIWQILASPGQALSRGVSVLTILPAGSSDTVLVPIPEESASGIAVGQRAELSGGGGVTDGEVVDVSDAPIPGDRTSELLGLPVDRTVSYIYVTIAPDEPQSPGGELFVSIITSESSLLSTLVAVD